MTISYTTRFGLPQWSAGTDTVSRTQFNSAFASIEADAAKDSQGTFASRPAFGEAGRYYYAVDRDVVYRDTGSAWTLVGGKSYDALALSSAPGAVAQTVQAAASQTADIFQVKDNEGVARSVFNSTGDFRSGGVYVASAANLTSSVRRSNAALSIHSLSTTAPSTVIRAIASQTSDLMQYQSSSGATVASIGANGDARFRNFRVGTTTERTNSSYQASILAGTVFADTTTESIWVWNGTEWVHPFQSVPWSALTGVPSSFTPSSHNHSASQITTGTLSVARIPNLSTSAITSGRFDNARLPTTIDVNSISASNIEAVASSPYLGVRRTSGGFNWGIYIDSNGMLTFDGTKTSGAPMSQTFGMRLVDGRFRAPGIYDYEVSNSSNVYITSNGDLSRSTSSARYKSNIEDAPSFRSVLDIQPRYFNSKRDPEAGKFYGAIAEEVDALGLHDLVEYNADGAPESIYYDKIGLALVPHVRSISERLSAIEAALGLV